MRVGAWLGVVVVSSLLLACGSSPGDSSGPHRPSINPNPDVQQPLPADFYLAGDITSDMVVNGVVRLTDQAEVTAGVTLTVEAGTTFLAAEGTALTVNGSLLVQGTMADPVTMDTDDTEWGGFVVVNGDADINYVDATNAYAFLVCEAGASACNISDSHIHGVRYVGQFRGPASIDSSVLEEMGNGGINVLAGSDVTVTNSYLRTASGDIIVMGGGNLTIDQSHIGGAQTEHCGFHINNGGTNGITLTNSVIKDNVYGFMLTSAASPVINGNNFINNSTTHLRSYGGNTNVDATGNYWDGGPPDTVDQTDMNEFDFSGELQAENVNAGPDFTP